MSLILNDKIGNHVLVTNLKAKSESLCLDPKGLIYIIKGDMKVKSKVLKRYGSNCEDSGQGLAVQLVICRRFGHVP